MNNEYQAFDTINLTGDPRLLIVCDHASNERPPGYGNLGLPETEFERHIAYDIGVAGLTRALAERLDCPAVLSRFSRLVIDPNRGEDDPTLVMKLSDGAIIPGTAAGPVPSSLPRGHRSGDQTQRGRDRSRPEHHLDPQLYTTASGPPAAPLASRSPL